MKVRGPALKVLLAALVMLSASPAGAQGRISNAKIETRTLSGSLEREVRAIAQRGNAVWIGYRTPMIPGRRQMCCSDSNACRLESGGGVVMTTGDAGGMVTTSNDAGARGSRIVLEPPADAIILARAENRIITRLRTFTPDCDLDGGAMPVVWLENVPAAESIAWLTALVKSTSAGDENRVVQPAIGALALHPDQAALRTLVALARDDQRSRVRSQSLFWLGQRAGQDAVATITNAIQNDPETEVKRRAVFALSRLPKDEGIPLLIQVARTNKNAEVRKQAMFWLGQSKDSRAVQFFEEVLLKP